MNNISHNANPSQPTAGTGHRILKILGIALAALLTLLPILNILWIVVSTGANVVSNDYYFYVGMIDLILAGKYDWHHFFRDTFIAGAHCMALPMLVRLVIVKLTDWNVYFELYTGIVLALLKLILLHRTFTHLTANTSQQQSRWVSRAALWPCLAALTFSTSQINTFTFGDAGLQIMLVQFGCALGIWGLVRFSGTGRESWTGIALMAAGGILATLSGGGGLLAWPVFLIGLLLLGYRKISQYIVWLSAAVVAALPYVFYIVIWPTQPPKKPTLFNYDFILSAVGWPFTNDIGTVYVSTPRSVQSGYLGLSFLLAGLILLWTKRKTPVLTQAAPALMYLALGLVGIWQTSLFRTSLAPWYTTAFLLFWIGLLGLAYVFWVNRPAFFVDKASIFRSASFASAWSVMLVGAVSYLYFTSNIAYADKAFYLNSRGPAAASCVRNYRIAPVSCEQYVFQWGGGHFQYLSDLARPLERQGISVFAPRQQWTLQGDYLLNNVRIEETPNTPQVFWSENLLAKSAPVSDYKHLNLFLHSPNKLFWQVALPSNVERADFHSAIAISKDVLGSAAADGVWVEISVKEEGQTEQTVFRQHLAANEHGWQPVDFSLTAYAGRTIVICLFSNPGGNADADWTLYRHPYIDVKLSAPVEDSPSKPFPVIPTAEDATFDLKNAELWQTSKMQLVQSDSETGGKWTITRGGSLAYKPALNLCLADFSHFYVKMAVAPEVTPRLMRFAYRLEGQTDFAAVNLPLYNDGAMHEYTFDLKLLFLNEKAHLTGLQMAPIADSVQPEEAWARIADFRLIRRQSPKGCAK